MPATSSKGLLDLPPELLCRILRHADLKTRVCLDSVCSALKTRIDPAVWGAVHLDMYQQATPSGAAVFLSLQRWLQRHTQHIKQLQLSKVQLYEEQRTDHEPLCDSAALTIVLSVLAAGSAPLAAMHVEEHAGTCLCASSISFVGCFGATMQQLVLKQICFFRLMAVQRMCESLPHMQDLALIFESDLSDPRLEVAPESNEGAGPDPLDLVKTAAMMMPQLRTLHLSFIGCLHHTEQLTHGLLTPEVSRLTVLTQLALQGLSLLTWPPEMSRLTQLSSFFVPDLWEAGGHTSQPLIHSLSELTGLKWLSTRRLSWAEPLPAASLTSLELDCLQQTWAEIQFPQLCWQLSHMLQLQRLVITWARWLQPHLPQLLRALQDCSALSILQLESCSLHEGLVNLTANDMRCIARLKTLSLRSNFGLFQSRVLDLCPPWMELACCRTLDLSYASLHEVSPQAIEVLAAMPLQTLVLDHWTVRQRMPTLCADVNAARQRSSPGAPHFEVRTGLLDELQNSLHVHFDACNSVLGRQLDGTVYVHTV